MLRERSELYQHCQNISLFAPKALPIVFVINVGKKKFLGKKKFWVRAEQNFSKKIRSKNFGSKTFLGQKNLEGGGSKLWLLVPWTIGGLHTKSWPPTMPRTLQKVLGRWVEEPEIIW